jgi:hypothetical protein
MTEDTDAACVDRRLVTEKVEGSHGVPNEVLPGGDILHRLPGWQALAATYPAFVVAKTSDAVFRQHRRDLLQ